MHKNRSHVASFLSLSASALLSIFILSSSAASQQTGIDLLELRDFAGAENVNGSGVNLLHVEAGSVETDGNGNVISRTYAPSPTNSFLNQKTFDDLGSPQSVGSNSHASTVGTGIYGFKGTSARNQRGTAPAVGSAGNPSIKLLSASQWLNIQILNNGGTPVAQNYDVSNHSYILSLDPANGFDQAAAENLLQRLDYVINEGNTTTVVGTNNGPTIPVGLVQAYNTINVGKTNGKHSSGLTTLNGPGRTNVHVVVDQGFTSYSTPVVSGAASILHQTGSGTDAVKQEVIKATILAGATKDDLVDVNRAPVVWSHSETQPLDMVYGAGELNVLNNHHIQQGGEFDGSTSDPASPVGLNGWDYEPSLATGEKRFYEFSVGEGQKLNDLSIALTWNINVENSSFFTFNPTTSLADLSLELYDSSTGFLAAEIDSSDSSVDNVEHIFISDLSAGTYHLRVTNKATGSFDTDFGLAFRSTAILLGDTNLSGGVDFFDITPLIDLFTTGDYQVEADLNCDGVVNFFDISGFISLLINN